VARVAVFFDWQNCYQQARVAFDLKKEPNERGVFNPFELARILSFGNRRGDQGDLIRVEIHRGLPSSGRDPKGNSAVLRHQAAWLALTPIVKVFLRPLRYNPDTGKPEEKGIDVALALSVVEHVIADFCDVAILFSHDTDLMPVVETIRRQRGPHRTETVSWKNDDTGYYKRIPPVPGVVNHTIRPETFARIETPISYSKDS
jgi:hypothetical protein